MGLTELTNWKKSKEQGWGSKKGAGVGETTETGEERNGQEAGALLGGVRTVEGRSTGEGRAVGKRADEVGDGRVKIRQTDREGPVAKKSRRTPAKAWGWNGARRRGP